jgi:Ohr subfamily peroxiredoxin
MATTIYTTDATATGGRVGTVTSAEANLTLTLDRPKAMGGQGAGQNPEQLFAMGYSACFTGALRAVAAKAGKNVDAATITAVVHFIKGEDGFSIGVDLKGAFPGTDKAEAKALMEAAHQVCPYSKATRGNIPVTLSVV